MVSPAQPALAKMGTAHPYACGWKTKDPMALYVRSGSATDPGVCLIKSVALHLGYTFFTDEEKEIGMNKTRQDVLNRHGGYKLGKHKGKKKGAGRNQGKSRRIDAKVFL